MKIGHESKDCRRALQFSDQAKLKKFSILQPGKENKNTVDNVGAVRTKQETKMTHDYDVYVICEGMIGVHGLALIDTDSYISMVNGNKK